MENFADAVCAGRYDEMFGIEPEFNIGDVVALKANDQLMVVEDYCEDCGTVSVVWFSGSDLYSAEFDAAMLVNLDDDSDE